MKSKIFNSSIRAIGFAAKSYLQEFSQLRNFRLNCKAGYSNAEKEILECANYLTSTPMDSSNLNREYAETLLLHWMISTSEFTFNIDKTIYEIIKSDLSLLNIYLAYAAKFVIENRSKSKDVNEINSNIVPLLLDYCRSQNNREEQNNLLKEILEDGSHVA
jgi:hypothetical protein